ncbi:CDK-activating kinase assembly factor MAT1 [Cavenderia fasciculata]|uniref:CDK-activating kinase assembly factor MAT1 n=1 Tax=Cavenderia fasciculata TaxID=261658 RepID=F4PZK4_CACFS|nr:CDK-activating kinase assembly factor MAT1 [Cavenderia fasciculata]EGG18768.1 CDK-activating kinase assembly factor MAT1 [Cavenderia fasciculata]|eukprot:XP_004357230.1 CDK-activating kinase assembly factor MAT1 [Cavenderia fasciculata]
MTAPCSHRYCESCIHAAYMKDAVLVCLGCNVQIRRQTFVSQRFDDVNDKENNTRRRVLRVYNKRREDFNNLNEYNDYLEIVEDLIFEFMRGGEHQALAEQKLKDYNKQNQQSIIINKKKKEEEDAKIASLIEEEQREAIEKRNFYKKQDLIDQTTKIQESIKAMEDLADGKISASELKELDRKKMIEQQQNNSATSILSYSESKKLMGAPETNILNNHNNQHQQQQQQNQQNQQPTTGDQSNKYSYQAKQQQQPQPVAQPHAIDSQHKPVFSQPMPTEQFKYDDLGLKDLIPTLKQSEASGFKQKYIKQRAFEEAFDFMIPTS